MGSTFDGCVGIVKAPDLGNCTQLLKMHSTFAECTNLVTGPETIPSNVDIMFSTFENCTALTGTIKINANPTEYWSCFEGTVNAIKISGSCSSTTKANLAGTAENGNVTY